MADLRLDDEGAAAQEEKGVQRVGLCPRPLPGRDETDARFGPAETDAVWAQFKGSGFELRQFGNCVGDPLVGRLDVEDVVVTRRIGSDRPAASE